MIYDISQPLLSAAVYPGDPAPVIEPLRRMENGDSYNLSALSMCLHNGTHVDAPRHFFKDGKGIDGVAIDKFIGPCTVLAAEGDLDAKTAEKILQAARDGKSSDAWRKILLKGHSVVLEEAAQVFADAGIDLIGTESQSVGPEEHPMAVHRILLKAEVVLLEGIRLTAVPDGVYFLTAAPLNLKDADGSPCRAVLVGDR